MKRHPPRSTLFPPTPLSHSMELQRGPLQPPERAVDDVEDRSSRSEVEQDVGVERRDQLPAAGDRKSTRLNSSHANISYAVFCLKKKQNINHPRTTRATTTSC